MIERVPAEGRGCIHDFVESSTFTFAVTNGLSCSQVAAHDFGNQESAVGGRNNAQAHDITNRVGQSITELLLFIFGEETQNSIDRLTGIDGMESTENQVPGFRGGQRDFHCFAIPDFAEQNCLWRLSQRCSQTVSEAVKIPSKFPMADRCLAWWMEEFDWIF